MFSEFSCSWPSQHICGLICFSEDIVYIIFSLLELALCTNQLEIAPFIKNLHRITNVEDFRISGFVCSSFILCIVGLLEPFLYFGLSISNFFSHALNSYVLDNHVCSMFLRQVDQVNCMLRN